MPSLSDCTKLLPRLAVGPWMVEDGVTRPVKDDVEVRDEDEAEEVESEMSQSEEL